MSFFEDLKKTALEAALKTFNGYSLAVSETQLNSLAPSLGATSNSLLARIGIEDIVIEASSITGKLRIHPASND